MRIAVIAPPWTPIPPTLYGGLERVVNDLAVGFDAAGHDVLLYTVGESTCPVPKRWMLPHAEGQRIGSAVPELRQVLHAYDEVQDFDIVHDHTILGPVLARLYPHLKVVTTIHGEFNEELLDLYGRVADRVAVIAISHDQASRAGDVPIARVIHHGIVAESYPVGEGDGGYAVFLGRMAPGKGPDVAIRAARAAGLPLVIATKIREKPERDYFTTCIEPLLGDDITVKPELDPDEKARLLGGAKALLFPISWNEPFGLVMVEAMACGTPVVAFPLGAVPEVVEDGVTGFVCDDEEAMGKALTRVDELDRAACRASIEGYFSARRMVADHLDLFEELLASR